MLVPSTTKGKHGEQLEHNPSELPFFQLFLRSLVNTVRGDADTGKYAFSVYLGIDVGTPLLHPVSGSPIHPLDMLTLLPLLSCV